MLDQKRVVLPGSDRKPLEGATVAAGHRHSERFEVTVRLRRKAPIKPEGAQHEDVLPADRKYMTCDQYLAQHGAKQEDVDLVTAFAKLYGLTVVDVSLARRSVFLSGCTEQFEKAFSTTIADMEHPGGGYRGRTGPLTIPESLSGIVEAVLGIDNRKIAKPHFQMAKRLQGATPHASHSSYNPNDVAKAYNFPTGVDGTGQCIALIELGGGYRLPDITAYFTKLGLKVPTVKTVRVDGGTNSPTTADGADGEVMLDIEVAAAVAPGATIVVYFAPNTDKGFLDAITMAAHDTVNKPSVISISWGGPEAQWTVQARVAMDQAFISASVLGLTICVAGGDNGSTDGMTDGKNHVDFPGSSPHALCCGGTRLGIGSSGQISSESVWNDNPTQSATGGGISDAFNVPVYQKSANIPPSANPNKKSGRGCPDVAGNADPSSGYNVRVDGGNYVIGGTSAVAPLYAGLVALLNQKLGHRCGYLHPLLYGSVQGKGAFNDITSGNNGAYHAQKGWDCCTGLGTPNGQALYIALGGK